MFPIEIWEKIISNTEAVTLVRLRTVNSSWNEIIKKHLQTSDAWHKQCISDIPKKYWLILLENSLHLTTLYQQGDINDKAVRYNNEIWFTMYKAWLKWNNLHKLSACTIYQFEPVPVRRQTEHVTCCAVLGELLAVGTTEGFIKVFNLCTSKVVFNIDQYEHVVDVKLCIHGEKSDKIILISTSILHKSRVWDVANKKKLITRSGDVICAGYGYYCSTLFFDKIIIYDAIAEDRYPARLCIKDFISSKIRTDNDFCLVPKMKYVNMIINRYQLCCWSDIGLYCEIDLREISKSINCLYMPSLKSIGVPPNEKVYKYYLFNPCVMFCVTDSGQLGVSVDKSQWLMYNIFPVFESRVTAIHFAIRVLVIGLDCGDICLYFVENESALTEIDFNAEKSKRIHIGMNPIVHVNIIEISGDQRILAATKYSIYLIKLDTAVSS